MRPLTAVLLTVSALVAGCGTENRTAAPPEPEKITLPGEVRHPNGIAAAANGTLYVGQITQPGVARRAPDGRWDMLFAGSPEIFAGTSLRLDESRGVLWGASPDFLPQGPERTPHVFALDANTGRVLHTAPLLDGFANDIALEPDGAILVTESRGGRVLRHRAGTTAFETVLADPRLTHSSNIGVGGIARAADGTLVLGNFGAGELFVSDGSGLRRLELPRLLERPDGIAFAPDGSLIVLESAPDSGDGRVLQVPNPLAAGIRELVTLADGLESPVNLAVGPDAKAYVSESRIRHRMVAALADRPAPTEFGIVIVDVAR